jgi:hypothetical protein
MPVHPDGDPECAGIFKTHYPAIGQRQRTSRLPVARLQGAFLWRPRFGLAVTTS